MKAVNLLPPDDRAGTGISGGRAGGAVFVVAGLLAGLALMALLYGLATRQIAHDTTEVASLTARAQQAQERAGQLAPYTSFLQMREQRAQAVAALVGSRFDWAQAFHELGRVLPAGKVALNSIEGSVGQTANGASGPTHTASAAASATVASATPPGSVPVFKLTGCAASQAEVALMLERLRLINGVSEVSLQSSTQSPPAAAGGAGTGGGSGGGCGGGNPAFTTQVTFDALPVVPTPSAGAATTTVASSASASAPTASPSASAPSASSAPAASAPASSASAPAATAPTATASSASEPLR